MKRLLKNLALWAFHIFFVRPVLKWGAGARYRGLQHLPKGPCLIVANHNSHLDAAVLMTLFPLRRLPRVHPVAAADYFGATRFKSTLAMALMNGIPIQRRPSMGSDPLGSVASQLEAGESLIFFPEGSRGEAGVVARFRPGVGRLVKRLPGLLVVPVFLSGPERIWPRGQMVPVPLNIDATVGRPRTYSTEDDARAIAEQVQRDVLALAPPPPPAPDPRPAPPVRIAVCGVEEGCRRAVFRELTGRLGQLGRTLGIADPMLESDAEGLREVTGPIPYARGRAWLGAWPWLLRARGRRRGRRFNEMVERARVDEALTDGRSARFVVTDGSALVDLMAWSEAEVYRGAFDASGMNRVMQYLSGERRIRFASWWTFIRKAPEVWLINIADLARPPVPDVLVRVNCPVPWLERTLRSRGEEQQPQRRAAALGRLQTTYGSVAEVLQKRRKVEVIDVDGCEDDPASIADRVEQVCRRLVDSPASASQ